METRITRGVKGWLSELTRVESLTEKARDNLVVQLRPCEQRRRLSPTQHQQTALNCSDDTNLTIK